MVVVGRGGEKLCKAGEIKHNVQDLLPLAGLAVSSVSCKAKQFSKDIKLFL